jgi:hypothetical protein
MGIFYITVKCNIIFLKFRQTNKIDVDEPSACSRTLLFQPVVTLGIKFQILPRAKGF